MNTKRRFLGLLAALPIIPFMKRTGAAESVPVPAYRCRYRDEWLAGFEHQKSLLRNSIVMEAEYDPRNVIFLVSDRSA